MKKTITVSALILAVIVCVAGIALSGCNKAVVSVSGLEQLESSDVSNLELTEDTLIEKTIVIAGDKTLSGTATISVGDHLSGEYAIRVPAGASLTVSGVTLSLESKASGIFVEEGGTLNIEGAVIDSGETTNVYNAGEFNITDGSLTFAGDTNVVNIGTAEIGGGTISSNGNSEKPVLDNRGALTFTGGTVSEGVACNILIADGAKLTMKGGNVKESGQTGILVESGGELCISSETAQIKNNGMDGIVNYGTVTVDDAVFIGNGDDHIENMQIGKLTVNGGQFMSAMGFGIKNRGYMEMTDGTITSSTYSGITNMGECRISGGEISYNNFRGITNKSGALLYITKGLVLKANTSANITNELDAECVVSNIEFNGGSSNQIHNRGTMTVTNCTLVDSGSNAVNNVGGKLVMTKCDIENTITNNGMYLTAGRVEMYNCAINNIASRAIQNAGADFYAKNLTIDNCAKSSVGNKTNPNNNTDGSIVIDNLTIKNPQGVPINNEGNGTITINGGTVAQTNGSTGVRIYSGTVTLNNVMLNGTTANSEKPEDSIHEIYLTGGTLNINNSTIHDTKTRAIQNAGGTVRATNLTVYNTGGTAIGNKAYEGVNGNTYIDGLSVEDCKGNYVINECDGTLSVANAEFAVLNGSSPVKIAEGTNGHMILTGCSFMGTTTSDETASIHAIYALGGTLDIYNCTFKNIQKRALQNKGATVTIDGMTATDCGGVVIGNTVGDNGEKGNITASNVTVKNTQSSSVVNEAEGTTITIKNSVLGETPKTNVSANAGTVVLENTSVYGSEKGASEKPAINVDVGAKVVVSGANSVISNKYFRAVVNHGVFVLENGNITNSECTASAGAVYTDGTFTMNGGSISGNTCGSTGGAVNIVSTTRGTGKMIMNGGTVTNNSAANTGGAISVQADTSLTVTGGTISDNSAGKNAPDIWVKGNIEIGGNAQIGNIYLLSGKSIKLLSRLNDAVNIAVETEDGLYEGRTIFTGSALALTTAVDNVSFVNDMGDNLYLGVYGYIESSLDTVAARIGNRNYKTLAGAFSAVPATGEKTEVVLLSNVLVNTAITVQENQNIVLTDDGTQRMIVRADDYSTGRMFIVKNGGSLTLQGTGDSMLIVDGNGSASDTSSYKNSQIVAVGTGKSDSEALFTLNDGAVLQNNNSDFGGAVVTYGKFIMNGGIIQNNRSVNDNGGAVAIQTTGSMVMNGGTVCRNSAGSSSVSKNSGAIHINANAESTQTAFTMNGGTITNNSASNYSGAITAQRPVVLNGGTISGNTANVAGTSGVRVTNADLTLGADIVLDQIWLGESKKIITTAALGAEDASIIVTYENASYKEGKTVISGTAVASNYAKFTLPESAGAATIGSDGKIFIDKTKLVAQIGNTQYASLSDAFAAVPTTGEETTVVLLRDVTVGAALQVKADQNIILTDDGTQRTITRASDFATGSVFEIQTDGKLTLSGSSNDDGNPTLIVDGADVATSTSSTTSKLVKIGTSEKEAQHSVFVLNSGVVLKNSNGKYGGAIILLSGSFTMNGGAIVNNTSETDAGGAIAIRGTVDASMVMNGGTISGNTAGTSSGAKQGGAIVIHANAAAASTNILTINGGTITDNYGGTNGGISCLSAKANAVVVNGGTITGNSMNSDLYTAGDVTVGGDADIGVIKSAGNVDLGGNVLIDTVNLTTSGNLIRLSSDLTNDALDVILVQLTAYESGTQVLSADSQTLLNNYQKFIPDNDSASITADGTIVNVKYVAKIGKVGYSSLAGAVAAAPTDGTETTIVLVDDIDLSAAVNIASGQNIVITDDAMTDEEDNVVARTVTRNADYNNGSMFVIAANAALTFSGTSQDDDNPSLIIDSDNVDCSAKNTYKTVMIGSSTSADENAEFTLNSGVVLQNAIGNYGSVLMIYGGTFNMNGGVIQNNRNKADNGSTIAMRGAYAKMIMSGGVIQNNSVDIANKNAAIIIHADVKTAGAFTMTGGSIINNTSLSDGYYGGLFYNGTASDVVRITGGIVTGNDGADIYSKGNITLGGNTLINGVFLYTAGLSVNLESALTNTVLDEDPITVAYKSYTVGNSVLTGNTDVVSSALPKFRLANANYVIDSSGRVAAAE